MTQAICHLCKKKKNLIKKSHIISEFLHKDLYDDNHKLIAFEPVELLKTNPIISRPSSGSYEGGLLCKDCDNLVIGKYETYTSKLLIGKLVEKEQIKCNLRKSRDGINILKLSGLNYSFLKLFLLSLLWRAHISSRDEYRDVKLGPYADKIRKALLYENPGADNEIIITITKLDPTAGFSTFIGQPIRHKVEQTTQYSIIINGYIVVYYLKENSLSKKVHDHRLTKEGTLIIMEIPKDQVSPFVMKYIGVGR